MQKLESTEPFASLALALAVGLLVGLERERTRPREGEPRSFFGGVRTFPLFSLLGAVATLLGEALGPWPFVLATAGTLLFALASYRKDLEQGHHGLTSEGAFVVTYLLGALATARGALEPFPQRALVVTALAVAVTVLLSAKVPLHQFSQRLAREDVIAALKLLIVGVVVLPLLPDRGYGPWGVLNPYDIGRMVALIAAVDFAGWAANRVLGPGRGMLLTGAIGGLVSSTAVTLAAAGRAKGSPPLRDVSALAAVLASSLMVLRVFAVVAVLNAALLRQVGVVLAAMAVGGLAFSAVLYRRAQRPAGTADLVLSNPFELSSAVKFAGLYTLVLVASRAGLEWFGPSAMYATGALGGATDVDAITLSMSNLAREGAISPTVAATTLFIGIASNTVVKAGIALVVGGWAFGRRVLLGLGLMAGLGLVALLATVGRA